MSLCDLDEIWDCITVELSNSDADENVMNGIMDIVEELKQFIGMETKIYFADGMDSGYRFAQYKNYIAFYHLTGTMVYVDGVIYCKRNFMSALFKGKTEE